MYPPPDILTPYTPADTKKNMWQECFTWMFLTQEVENMKICSHLGLVCYISQPIRPNFTQTVPFYAFFGLSWCAHIISHQITSFTCASSNSFHIFCSWEIVSSCMYIPQSIHSIPDPSLISHYHVNDLHNGIFTLNHPSILYQLEKAKYVFCFPDQTTNPEFRIFTNIFDQQESFV